MSTCLRSGLFLIGVLWILFSRLPALYGAEQKSWQEEWEKTVSAAKKEGKLAVFLYQRDNIEAAVKAFEKRYPEIQVNTVATPAADTGPRLMAERRAEKYLWDICICGPTTPFSVLYPAKTLDPIKPALMLPEVVDESKWWGGQHHYMDPEGKQIFVFIGTVEMPNVYYNKSLVRTDGLKSFQDLLDPKWKGKLIVMDPRQPGRPRVSARVIYHLPELGPKFLQRLFAEMDVTISREDRQALDWLAVGKFSVCVFCGRVFYAKAQGLPVDEFKTSTWVKTPAIYSGSNGTLALLNKAPHPNAAKVFVNWLLSRDGQTTFQKTMNSPDITMESMRIDISKDPVPSEDRRVEGVNYIIMDTSERSDQAPVSKLLKEIIQK